MKSLSDKYTNGVVVTPHISVNSSSFVDLEYAKEAVNSSVADINKFEVKTGPIKFTDKWWKSFYIQLHNDINLIEISKNLDKWFRKDKTTYDLDAHISLMYREGLDAKTKSEIARKITFPDKLLVAGIAVIEPGTEKGWDDVNDINKWNVVYKKELA